MSYLTSNNEQSLKDLQSKVWVNKIREQAAKNPSLLGDGDKKVDTLNGMTDDEILNLQIESIKDGKIVREEKGSTNWAEIRKVYNQEKWYILKPDEKFMVGVDMTNIQEEEYNKDWVKPIIKLEEES